MVKVIFTISPELKQDMDEYCDAQKYNRSEFLRYAIREIIYIDHRKAQQRSLSKT